MQGQKQKYTQVVNNTEELIVFFEFLKRQDGNVTQILHNPKSGDIIVYYLLEKFDPDSNVNSVIRE